MKTKQLLFFCIAILLFKTSPYKAQADTIKLMTYNVGNFGEVPTTSCPLFDFNLKSAFLRTILKYENPDIVGMAKISAGATFCTDSIVHYVLDSVCAGCWGYGIFSQISPYPKANMLYFNTNKIGFVSSTVIYSADNNISDITLHKLYYKASDLATTHDTVFLKIVLAHLESGSGNTSGRGNEVAGVMTWLNANITGNENLIFMGDLNTTTSTETCFQDLINSSNNNTKFYDPPNQLGNWAGSPSSFANYLTQSTRTSDPGDCNATGGMDNRFDHILITSAIKNGTDSVSYIAGSYKVIGQDGQHTNVSLLHSPANTSVPANVDSALYYMSEHLPVKINMLIKHANTTGIANYANQAASVLIAPNPFSCQTTITFTEEQKNTTLKITDATGKEIKILQLSGKQLIIEKGELQAGFYFLQITDEKKNVINKKIVIQ